MQGFTDSVYFENSSKSSNLYSQHTEISSTSFLWSFIRGRYDTSPLGFSGLSQLILTDVAVLLSTVTFRILLGTIIRSNENLIKIYKNLYFIK